MTIPDEVEIRPLRFHEIPKLLKFRSRNDYYASGDMATVDSLLHFFLKAIWHRHRMRTFVATREGALVGYLSLVLGRQRKQRENIYIVSTAVSAENRGQGIGTLLFKELENYAKLRAVKRIELEVFSRNTGAIKLYKRLGYEIEGVKRHAVESEDSYDDLVIMAKLLN
ncbi:MAG: GNAT family N-acetyltransferase [Candidatus Zambryskibacteria bacterium]|nr:GNAT family N-acetyltransferase [Candidatus Zambryskibacteria bacterium]